MFKLQGFNNLTKTLSFNIYDVCYAKTDQQRKDYIEYIDEAYNAKRLTQM
ncbi:MAG TPA: S-adenosylmethionine decarboxylase, partial [Thioploca sp.]|nr:S-adenosylmethionine decarboxylase [Thioploca sp.]